MNDILGYAASLAVLATFLMRSMVALRLVAILSNVLFVAYGHFAHIHPILLLHSVLFPINLARLSSCRSDGAKLFNRDNLVAPAMTTTRSFWPAGPGRAGVSPLVCSIVRRTHALLWNRGSA